MASELKVVVVDDDDMIRSVVRIAVQKVDTMVIEAASGPEGLTVASAEHPNVVLLDFQMPKMDGAETLRQLKADLEIAAIPIIFLTAKTGRKARSEYLQMGAIGTIEKPFDPLTLGKEIVSLMTSAKGA